MYSTINILIVFKDPQETKGFADPIKSYVNYIKQNGQFYGLINMFIK